MTLAALAIPYMIFQGDGIEFLSMQKYVDLPSAPLGSLFYVLSPTYQAAVPRACCNPLDVRPRPAPMF